MPAVEPASPDGGLGIGRALRRFWPVLLLVAAAAVAASLLVTARQEPQYEATAQLLVTPLSQSETELFGTFLIRDAGDAAQTPDTVAILIQSDAVATETARRLGEGWTPPAVLEAVTVEPAGETNILNVIATTDDPEESASVASTFARSVIKVRKEELVPDLQERYDTLEERRRRLPADDYSQRDRLYREMRLLENTLNQGGDPTLRFVDPAIAPTETTARSPLVIAAIALAGGLLLGIAAAVALDRLRPAQRAPRSSGAAETA